MKIKVVYKRTMSTCNSDDVCLNSFNNNNCDETDTDDVEHICKTGKCETEMDGIECECDDHDSGKDIEQSQVDDENEVEDNIDADLEYNCDDCGCDYDNCDCGDYQSDDIDLNDEGDYDGDNECDDTVDEENLQDDVDEDKEDKKCDCASNKSTTNIPYSYEEMSKPITSFEAILIRDRIDNLWYTCTAYFLGIASMVITAGVYSRC